MMPQLRSQSIGITSRLQRTVARVLAVSLAGCIAAKLHAVEHSAPTSARARQLMLEIVSADSKVREQRFKDLINGNYRDLTESERLAAVLLSMQTPDPDIHSNQGLLIEQLPQIAGTQAKTALPRLLEYVDDAKISGYLRGRAIFAAVRIAPQDDRVLAAMIRSTSSVDHSLQLESIEELGTIGASAKSALSTLVALLADKDGGVQDASFEALGRIEFAAAPKEDFASAITDKDPAPRAAAHIQIRALAELARSSAGNRPFRKSIETRHLTALRDILENHPDDFDSRAALKTVALTGPGADPRMIKALLMHANHSPYTAKQTLEQLDPSDSAGVDILLESLRKTSREPRGIATIAAVCGLQKYGRRAQKSAPDLIAGFDRLISIPNHEFAVEDVGDYLAAMVAVDPANEAVVSRVLDMIAADHPLNHPNKPYRPVAPLAWEVFSRIGLPSDPKLHKVAVGRLAAALDDPATAEVASRVLEHTSPEVLRPDASKFVPLLKQIILAPRPRDQQQHQIELENGQVCVAAICVLPRFGAAAKDALPLIEELSARELHSSFDTQDHCEDSITRAARTSAAAIAALPNP